MQNIQSIQHRIYTVRGERVMLDRDLAELYETEPRVLNQAVQRNIKRFPEDFMFQLTKEEWASIEMERSADWHSNEISRSQIVILKSGWGKNTKYLPYAFTEQGVAMLSSVLRSNKAIHMNIAIMRVFVNMRRAIFMHDDVKVQLQQIKERLGEHDVQLNQIYDALENMLDEKAAEKKWDDRERIGFNRGS